MFMGKLINDLKMLNSMMEMNTHITKLESKGTEYNAEKFTKKFAEGRDMMLLEVDGLVCDGITMNAKYYCDKEFDSYHYSIEKDMKIMHEYYINKIKSDESINEDEKLNKISEIIKSEKYIADQERISNKLKYRKTVSFEEYTMVGGLYFFDDSDRAKIKEILANQYGESIKFDGHDLWSTYSNRIELGPTIFTYIAEFSEK